MGGTSCFTFAIMAFVEVVMTGIQESDWAGGDIGQLFVRVSVKNPEE